MKKFLKKISGSLSFNVIGGFVGYTIIFGLIIVTISNIIFINTFKAEYAETTYHMADAASALVDGAYIPYFLKGENKLEYSRIQRELDVCCEKMFVSIIYVIAVDQSDYGSYISVFNSVNNEVDNTNYVPWELGYKRETSNDEYKQKYKALYEQGSTYETVYRIRSNGNERPHNSHITTVVPIKNHTGEVVALLCMQRPLDELMDKMFPYLVTVSISAFMFANIFNVLISLFIKYRIIKPVSEVSEEALRFAEEGTKGNLRNDISNYKVFSDLSTSINSMETDLTQYIEDITSITAEKERIGAELDIAKRIQFDMLPSIFPPFPDRKEFDIYASMTPAKEVGGDFYNFFFIDDDHLALVIADVSGKGIPAALFMMVTSIIISDIAKTGKTPSEVLTKANERICSHNKADMFVTVWLGVLEISTGRLISSNAGHEDPAVCRKNGDFELWKSKHGLMLGTLEGIKYADFEFRLNKGDKLFLYTDGVHEATNEQDEMFRIDCMLDALNSYKEKSPTEILKGMHNSINTFVGDAPQFDDLTMLCIEMKDDFVSESLTLDATLDNLDKADSFVGGVLDKLGCDSGIKKQIALAFEECFVNIVSYAYGDNCGKAEITVEGDRSKVTLILKDSGSPFDPLDNPDPDLSLSVQDREIGGLGVYLTKKSMDSVAYEYTDNQNVLTMEKRLTGGVGSE